MSARADAIDRPVVANRTRTPPRRIALYAFLTLMAVTWLFPLLWALYTAFRPYSDTLKNGYISLPGALNLDNFVNAFNQANFPRFYLNTLIITIPAVIATLFVASMVAFAVSRYSWRFNLLTRSFSYSDSLYRLYGLKPIDGINLAKLLQLVHPEDKALMTEVKDRKSVV